MYRFRLKLKLFSNGPISNIPSVVQIMAWRRPGDRPLSEPMMDILLTQICVTRPQWVYNAALSHLKFRSQSLIATKTLKEAKKVHICLLIPLDMLTYKRTKSTDSKKVSTYANTMACVSINEVVIGWYHRYFGIKLFPVPISTSCQLDWTSHPTKPHHHPPHHHPSFQSVPSRLTLIRNVSVLLTTSYRKVANSETPLNR